MTHLFRLPDTAPLLTRQRLHRRPCGRLLRPLTPWLCLIAPLGAGGPVQAQTSPAPAPSLERVVVTGNPLDRRETGAPVSVLDADALVLRRGSSLGSTLDGLPGVSSSYFGPNANRPVIRGLDGDRVRILNNAGASLDASSLSFDHAVPIDPLVVERIEVLRGPGALLYGGSAIGGVVNTLDNRIPRAPMRGTSGAAEWRLGGADHERGAAWLLETGNDRAGLHVDLAGRRTSDLSVPGFTPVIDGVAGPRTDRVANSASRSHSGAVGGSLFFDHGYIGMSVDRHDHRYGIVVEPDVTVDLQREHLGLAGELRAAGGTSLFGFNRLRGNLNTTRYQHQEIEGSGAIGTTFRTSGHELRLEATHAPLPVGLRGVVGLQLEDSDFSALGEEAFVPSTRTRKQSLFALEELGWVGGTASAGLRLERVRVRSDGDADPAGLQFGPAAARRFSLRSVSLGNVLPLTPAWSLSAAFSATERAPTSFELYANGVHAATAAVERGDPGLGTERGRNLDLALRWARGDSRLRIGGYLSRYARFIALDATGVTVDLPTEEGGIERFPEYAFRSVRARLHGAEIEAGHRWHPGRWTLDASAQVDLTRARNVDTGEALPRVAPLRWRIGLVANRGPWSAGLELLKAAHQRRVPATDTETAGYSLVKLSLSRRVSLGGTQAPDALWFVTLNNATDRLAYSASAVQTVRGLSPLPGRSLQTGLRVGF